MAAPSTLRITVVAAALLATLALTNVGVPVSASAPPHLDALPYALGPWSGAVAPPLDPQVANVLAADQYVHRFYDGPGGRIEMDVAYYSQPRIGANMHSPLNCLPGTGWQVLDIRDVDVATPAGAWPLRDTLVERRGARFALTYWFQSRARVVNGEISTRLYLLGDALRGRPTDAGIVRLIRPIQGDAAAERRTLAAFAGHLIPALATRLH